MDDQYIVGYLPIKGHISELKTRLLRVTTIFTITFIICYILRELIFDAILQPLRLIISLEQNKNIIYTNLTEAFFSYLKLAAFSAIFITLPFLVLEIYLFIKPALKAREKTVALFILSLSPILFFLGSFFVYYYVMPKAWRFFLSFQNYQSAVPIVLDAKISEYINLVIDLVIAFGVAFQLPVILIILNLLNIISVTTLKNKRRFAIVINFIVAGIITPPDVISQILLAIPLILLYELSIIVCDFLNKKTVRF